ncbi:MAG TPA: SpoVG family protein [Pirellulales bacterium]
MEITEIRIKLMEEAGERLQAFCSITFDDCFVIRDLKIIEGTSGPFVAMPSRKLTGHCPGCGCKNHLRAAYCNQCGGRLKEDRAARDEDGRAKLYADIAHPINSTCREMIQERVIQSFHAEIERSRLPGYVSSYDDFDEDIAPAPRGERKPRRTAEPHPTHAHSAHAHPAPAHAAPARLAEPQPAALSPPAVAIEAKLEPAATEPRAPHKVPAPHSQPRHAEAAKDSFGAGIL